LLGQGDEVNDRTERRNVPVRSAAAPTDLERRSLQNELDEVRAELAEERSRRLVAEALAQERATALEHARVALKALEALAAVVSADDERAKKAVVEPPKPRGQWLK
jgi:hypothetical protein